MIDTKEIGLRLKVARQLQRLTQAQLGEELDVSRVTISDRERGADMPLTAFCAHCKALNQNPASMLARRPPWESFASAREEWRRLTK